MKQLLPKILLVAMVAVAWVAGVGMVAAQSESIEDVERQIAENEDLKTYKNVLADYDKMISEYPGDITWYERKANAYYQMGEFKNYVAVCETIASTFPEDLSGYDKLMTYYDETSDYKALFEVYEAVPDGLKSNERLQELYEKHEYTYSYVSGSYSSVTPIRNGYGLVEADGYFGFVDSTGSLAIECTFDEAKPFVEKTAAVKKADEWYLIDAEGDRVRASREAMEELFIPSEGYAVARIGGKYGYLSDELTDPQHFEYDGATSFYNGVAAVKQEEKWALVNTSFEMLTGFDFDEVVVDDANVCSRGGLVFAQKDGSYRLYSTAGEQKGNEAFEAAKVFAGDWAAVAQNGKWGFVDQEGSKVIECQYEDAQSFNLDIAPVKANGEWAFVDKSGAVVVSEIAEPSSLSSDGIAGISAGHGMRYIRFYKYAFEEQ